MRRATEVVVADRRSLSPVTDRRTPACGINVIDIVSFLERETGRSVIDMLGPAGSVSGWLRTRDPRGLPSAC